MTLFYGRAENFHRGGVLYLYYNTRMTIRNNKEKTQQCKSICTFLQLLHRSIIAFMNRMILSELGQAYSEKHGFGVLSRVGNRKSDTWN